jgi:uncharacterized protein YciI
VTYFAVFRQREGSWDWSRGMREQNDWHAHAVFMDGLAAEGFVVLGGPLGDGKRALHIVEAADEAVVLARLAEDPWEITGLLRTASVEPWEVLLRAGRAAGADPRELFDEPNGEHVRAELRIDASGDLVLEGYCAGPLAEQLFGDSDWEYWVTVPAD